MCTRHKYCLKNGVNSLQDIWFSPQNMLTCNSGFDCNGGWPNKVIDYMVGVGNRGVCCMPYMQGKGNPILGVCPVDDQSCDKIH